MNLSNCTLVIGQITIGEVVGGFLKHEPAPESMEKAQFLLGHDWFLLPTILFSLTEEMEQESYTIWEHEPVYEKEQCMAVLRDVSDGKVDGLEEAHAKFEEKADAVHERFFSDAAKDTYYAEMSLEDALDPAWVYSQAKDIIAQQVVKLGIDSTNEQQLVAVERVAYQPRRSPAWSGLVRLVIWTNWRVQAHGRIKKDLRMDTAWLRHSLMVDTVLTRDGPAREIGMQIFPEIAFPGVPKPD